MKNFCVQFCGALKSFRAKAGMGQIAFAKELGLSQPVYARYEKGDREPTLNELIRIAQILHTTPNVLLGFAPPPQLRDSAAPREIPSVHTGDIKGNGNIVAVGSHNTTINAGGGVRHHHRQPAPKTKKRKAEEHERR